MKHSVLMLFFAIVLLQCKQNEEDLILINVQNNTEYNFDSVLIESAGENNYFGRLDAYKISKFQSSKNASYESSVSLYIDKERYNYINITATAYIPLKNGKYTFILENPDSTYNSISRKIQPD